MAVDAAPDPGASPADDALPAPTAVAERRIAVAFLASTAAALGLAAVYVGGGQPQAEGALLFVALGGLGVGAVQWARQIDDGPVTDDRGELAGSESDQAAVVDEVSRRRRATSAAENCWSGCCWARSEPWAWPPCSRSGPSAPAPATP